MPSSPEGFEQRITDLKADMVAQTQRVLDMLERAVEMVFERDADGAAALVNADDIVDRYDVQIEKDSVRLLADATNQTAALNDDQLRSILTVVKVNNEAERIADAACALADLVPTLVLLREALPETFRVLSNSVIGIVRDANTAYDNYDAKVATIALQSEATVEQFTAALIREAEQRLADQKVSVDLAFVLHEAARQCELIGDHASNIAQQVIYSVTGKIVRHVEGEWIDVHGSP